MSATPTVTTGPIFDKSDEPIVERLRRANWQHSGYSSEYDHKRSVTSPPTYKAHFGEDIAQVVSFLNKMKTQGKTKDTHASANYDAKDGFVIISSWELERLGISPEKQRQR